MFKKWLSRDGKLKEAREVINTFHDKVGEMGGELHFDDDPLVNQMEMDMTDISKGLESSESFRRKGAHLIGNKVQGHMMQRCQESSAISSNAYHTKKKCSMAHKFGFK